MEKGAGFKTLIEYRNDTKNLHPQIATKKVLSLTEHPFLIYSVLPNLPLNALKVQILHKFIC